MKNRCAILTAFDPYSFKGGIEIYTCQLVALLQSKGITVDIYHPDRLPDAAEDAAASQPLHSYFLNRLYRLGQSFYWVDHLYDFVVSHAFLWVQLYSATDSSFHYSALDPCAIC